MGLISKIEDKLSSNKDDKYERQNYDSNTGSTGTTSKLQHPISSSSGGTYGTSTGNTSGKEYGRYPQDESRYTNTMQDRVPGSHITQNESHVPTHTTTTSTSTRTEPRQAYDPYSSKGQEAAARGTTGIGSSHDRHGEHYGVTGRDEASHVRSKDGGILNHSSDQRHGDQRYTDDRYASHQISSNSPTTGQHHYGRDAAMAGGAGAAGLGAYEVGKDHPSSQPLTANPGQQQYQDVSYMQQPQHNVHQAQHSSRDASMAGGAMEPGAMGSQGQMPGESPGLTQARKMGGAYEAGYKDAMEHMQKEMAQKGPGSAF